MSTRLEIEALLFDLDDTLVLTDSIEPLRRAGRWAEVEAAFPSTSLPPGTADFIDRCKAACPIGVVTTSPRRYAERLLAHHGLVVPVLVAYHDVATRKPDPGPIIEGAARLQASRRGVVYVGDDAADVGAAISAGANAIMDWAGNPPEPDVVGRSLGLFRSWESLAARLGWSVAAEDASSFRYDPHGLARCFLQAWDGDDYAVFWYVPRPTVRDGDRGEAKKFILDLKDGDAWALEFATAVIIDAVGSLESLFRDSRRCAYVMTVPPHSPGHRVRCSETVAQALAGRFPWLTHVPYALQRVEGVAKSATAARGCRPSIDDHLRTIAYRGPKMSLAGSSVLLLDDVITLGATSEACRRILARATGCDAVLGLFLGRTAH